MSVFMVIETLEIIDQETCIEYASKAKPIIESFGGRYLASSDKVQPLGGGWEPMKMLIIHFPDMKTLLKCFDSEEYKAIVHLRKKALRGKSVIVPAL